MCHCGNMQSEWTPNKSQYRKLTLEKKILLPLLPGFELATFRSQVWRLYQQAILASQCAGVVSIALVKLTVLCHQFNAHLFYFWCIMQCPSVTVASS